MTTIIVTKTFPESDLNLRNSFSVKWIILGIQKQNHSVRFQAVFSRYPAALALLPSAILLAVLTAGPSPAIAAQTVSGLISTTSCGDHYFVSTPNGYSVLSWMGGGELLGDDVVSGVLEREGEAKVVDKRTGQMVVVEVEKALLSNTAYEAAVVALCP